MSTADDRLSSTTGTSLQILPLKKATRNKGPRSRRRPNAGAGAAANGSGPPSDTPGEELQLRPASSVHSDQMLMGESVEVGRSSTPRRFDEPRAQPPPSSRESVPPVEGLMDESGDFVVEGEEQEVLMDDVTEVSSIGYYYDRLSRPMAGQGGGSERPAVRAVSRPYSRTFSQAPSVIASPAGPVTLAWRHVNVSLKAKKTTWKDSISKVFRGRGGHEDVEVGCALGKQLLHQVNGIVQPGQLVALMGASGAGKSTLLNTLVGRGTQQLHITGDILVNGRSIGEGISSVAAYVQQDDVFLGTLTVREHLMFQAHLRLPPGVNATKRRRRVEEVLADMGLKRCADVVIGVPGVIKGISGGESRRLSFASEILKNPPLLFCDEPTTGLDSFMAESLVLTLQKLADRGKTIMCTVHQPASEIYALFDRVLFLAEGRVAYFGPAEEALGFFAALGMHCPMDYNPADYFIEQLAISGEPDKAVGQFSRARVNAICDGFDRSRYAEVVQDDINASIQHCQLQPHANEAMDKLLKQSKYSAMFMTQFILLLFRSLANNFRNPVIALSRIGQKLVMAALVCGVYPHSILNQDGIQNLNGAFFFMMQQLIYPAQFGVLEYLPSEFPLVVREYYNCLYSIFAYYSSKAVSYMPVYSVDGVIMFAISYYVLGFNGSIMAFIMTLFITVVVEQTATAMGLMISAAAPDYPTGVSVAGPLLTLFSLTGGLFANAATLPPWVSWFQYLSFFRYGFEAYTVNQWVGITDIACDDIPIVANATTKQMQNAVCQSNGEQVLQTLGFGATYAFLWRDIILMGGLMLLFGLIGYSGLMYRVHRAK